MIITDVIELNKKKYKIYVDHEFAFVLYKGEFHKYRLKKDAVITEEVYRELTQEVLPKRAKLRAMHLLTQRPYTEQKLREKLMEGLYSPESTEAAIAYVKSFGYLNDKSYAEDYITYHISTQSRRVMEQKLLSKGINAKIIAECMEEVGTQECMDAEQQQIRQLFFKKYKGCFPADNNERAKMINFFARKGYSVTSVKHALDGISLDDLYN